MKKSGLALELLIQIWDGLGKYSGQIQSIIAIVAFILAIFGYFKVLAQLKLSKAQEEMAIDQRNFNLKILSINTIFSALDHNLRSQKELYELKRFIKEDMKVNNEEEKEIRKELIEKLDSQIEASEKIRKKMIETCETFSALKHNGQTVRDGKMLDLAIKSILIDLNDSQRNELLRQALSQSTE